MEVGCGYGVSFKYFLQTNIESTGIKNLKIAISRSFVSENIIRHNLKNKIDLRQNFNLGWWLNVIKHIYKKFEAVFLQTLVLHAGRVIISAAKPGKGCHGHFDGQLPAYWISRFLNWDLI